ncbi:9753_t:CDS:2, partial [Gigaspora margarita]
NPTINTLENAQCDIKYFCAQKKDIISPVMNPLDDDSPTMMFIWRYNTRKLKLFLKKCTTFRKVEECSKDPHH